MRNHGWWAGAYPYSINQSARAISIESDVLLYNAVPGTSPIDAHINGMWPVEKNHRWGRGDIHTACHAAVAYISSHLRSSASHPTLATLMQRHPGLSFHTPMLENAKLEIGQKKGSILFGWSGMRSMDSLCDDEKISIIKIQVKMNTHIAWTDYTPKGMGAGTFWCCCPASYPPSTDVHVYGLSQVTVPSARAMSEPTDLWPNWGI